MQLNVNQYNADAVDKVQEIDSMLQEEEDGKRRQQLMFEQMLRGLWLNRVRL